MQALIIALKLECYTIFKGGIYQTGRDKLKHYEKVPRAYENLNPAILSEHFLLPEKWCIFSTYEKNVKVVLLDGNFTRVHEVDQVFQLVELDLAEDDCRMVGRILR